MRNGRNGAPPKAGNTPARNPYLVVIWRPLFPTSVVLIRESMGCASGAIRASHRWRIRSGDLMSFRPLTQSNPSLWRRMRWCDMSYSVKSISGTGWYRQNCIRTQGADAEQYIWRAMSWYMFHPVPISARRSLDVEASKQDSIPTTTGWNEVARSLATPGYRLSKSSCYRTQLQAAKEPPIRPRYRGCWVKACDWHRKPPFVVCRYAQAAAFQAALAYVEFTLPF